MRKAPKKAKRGSLAANLAEVVKENTAGEAQAKGPLFDAGLPFKHYLVEIGHDFPDDHNVLRKIVSGCIRGENVLAEASNEHPTSAIHVREVVFERRWMVNGKR